MRKVFLVLVLCWGANDVVGQALPSPQELTGSEAGGVLQAIQSVERRAIGEVGIPAITTIDSALLLPDVPYRNRFFLLAGWLGRIEALQAVPYEYRRNTRMQNDYDLAMIRAGDASRMDRLRTLLRNAVVDDDFVYTIAPKLVYTRRREVFDFLFDQILLDQRNCSTADPHGSGQINCAYRLLELVAPHIRNFPLKVGVSGDLETDDYPSALETARAWIEANRADYLIITETF